MISNIESKLDELRTIGTNYKHLSDFRTLAIRIYEIMQHLNKTGTILDGNLINTPKENK